MRPTKMLPILALVLIAALAPSLANAAIWTLTDANSVAKIDDGFSQSGMNFWAVDGADQMYQQWFWYRVGNTPEASIDTLGPPTIAAQLAPNILMLQYTSPGQFTIDVAYTLFGGQPGTGTSDMGELIRINNIGTTTLDFHFFQYTDFDLMGPGGDTGRLLYPNTVVQVGQGVVTETAVVTTPNRYELALFAQTLNALNDGVATNLNNNPGPVVGDVTWAFQWDKTLFQNGSFLISKDKHIGVPIPGSVVLLGSGLIGLAGLGWRRRKKTD